MCINLQEQSYLLYGLLLTVILYCAQYPVGKEYAKQNAIADVINAQCKRIIWPDFSSGDSVEVTNVGGVLEVDVARETNCLCL